jgi:hypothetical protein
MGQVFTIFLHKLLYLIVVEIKFQFAAYAIYIELYCRNYILLKGSSKIPIYKTSSNYVNNDIISQ